MRGPAEPTHPRRETRRDQTHYWKEKLGTIDGTRRALTTSIGRRPLERATLTNLPASNRCAIAQRPNSAASMQNNFQDFAFDLNSSSPRIFFPPSWSDGILLFSTGQWSHPARSSGSSKNRPDETETKAPSTQPVRLDFSHRSNSASKFYSNCSHDLSALIGDEFRTQPIC
jgi:hypothetical protein